MKWKPHVVYFSWDETVTRRDSGYWFCVLSHGQSQAGFAKACAFFSSCVLFSRFPYIPQSQDLAAQGKWMFEWGLSTAPFIIWASLGAQWERILLPMQETWVQSLGWEIPWRRKWQPTPVFLPGNAMDREAWWTVVHGSKRVGHDLVTKQQPHPSFEARCILRLAFIWTPWGRRLGILKDLSMIHLSLLESASISLHPSS